MMCDQFVLLLLQVALLQWCIQGCVASGLQLSALPSHKTAVPFCPTEQVSQVGQVTLDHMQLIKVSLDWPGVLTNFIVMSCVIFTTALLTQLPKGTLVNCLSNRWEFQQEAWLDADESSLLSIIKNKLNI